MHLSELLDLIKADTRLKPEWGSPDYLADLLPRLASYYSSLGEFLADAERDADMAEIAYKVERESRVAAAMEEGATATAAAPLAVIHSADERREYVKLKHKYRLLFLARKSLEKNMDSIRSKLSFIKRDMDNQR